EDALVVRLYLAPFHHGPATGTDPSAGVPRKPCHTAAADPCAVARSNCIAEGCAGANHFQIFDYHIGPRRKYVEVDSGGPSADMSIANANPVAGDARINCSL